MNENEGGTATATPKNRQQQQAKAAEQPKASGPRPCIGLPVQFTLVGDEIIPGRLQRQSATDPTAWDVKISLSGAAVEVTRPAVAFSATPKPGCWSFLPGWTYQPPQ